MGMSESRMGSPTSSFSAAATLGGTGGDQQQFAHKPDAAGAGIFSAMTEPCLAVGSPGTSGNGKIRGTPYDYNADDCQGTPRTDSPDDVLSVDLGIQMARSLPVRASRHAESTAGSLSSPNSATSSVAASPLEREVGQTPPSINFFLGHGKRLRPHDEETGQTTRSVAEVGLSPAHSQEHIRECPQTPCTTGIAARRSAPAMDSSLRHMNTCSECHAEFSGPTYMLNDLAYCCQRHRLLAYQKLQDQKVRLGPSSGSEADLHILLPTGVRSQFCAW
eukprot:CAMPEP_0119070688 /NCGR_PEP_ID=MMETSP1178-20130426/42881_1 /TAXON_ID=33656 /ORGANISM="unid sp, Strain CCMP2000" /LENGTH=275 /DNA_ID=CAMNT_0007052543 /DNA_START=45 /DNA_END=869 /DNA_ORIENTATION=+